MRMVLFSDASGCGTSSERRFLTKDSVESLIVKNQQLGEGER